MKILSILALIVLLVACSDTGHHVVPDMTPVGEGLRTIGYAIITVAVSIVVTVFRLLH